mmetsp:Transcript_28692/g.47494  ORF Transcript_28692/g.47494 Transcript_28692/m.47494 type:complete len:231 (+) Transcript_28692:369-1061(+)
MRAPAAVAKGDFIFDTGPSFFSGLNPDLPAKASNPLRTILDAIDERVDCEAYTSFGLVLPEGNFVHTPDFGKPGGVVDQVVGTTAAAGDDDGVQQWQSVMRAMAPLARVVDALPTAAQESERRTESIFVADARKGYSRHSRSNCPVTSGHAPHPPTILESPPRIVRSSYSCRRGILSVPENANRGVVGVWRFVLSWYWSARGDRIGVVDSQLCVSGLDPTATETAGEDAK